MKKFLGLASAGILFLGGVLAPSATAAVPSTVATKSSVHVAGSAAKKSKCIDRISAGRPTRTQSGIMMEGNWLNCAGRFNRVTLVLQQAMTKPLGGCCIWGIRAGSASYSVSKGAGGAGLRIKYQIRGKYRVVATASRCVKNKKTKKTRCVAVKGLSSVSSQAVL